MSTETESAKVKELWGDSQAALWRTSKCLHWVEHPKVRERLNLLITGNPGQDRFQYFLEKYFRQSSPRFTPLKRIITLGCGHGEFERGLAKYQFAKTHEAVDLAPGAISKARELAQEDGLKHIRYWVADLNSIELPRSSYDVAFGISSIHHVSHLEHLFYQVAQSLKPGGYLFLDEFIGPNKFQWTDQQLHLINEQAAALPFELKRSLLDGKPKGNIWRHSPQQMDEVDPSEAVRSADILRVLPYFFDIVEFKGYGGSLLHLLLEGIAGNFSPDVPGAMEYLESLFCLEDALIASGEMQHDFGVIIARRKATRAERIFGPKIGPFVSRTKAMLWH